MPAPDRRTAKPNSGLTNSVANVLGLLIPLAVFLVVTPAIVRGLGVAHFGVLSLFVTVLTLLTSFDLGLAAGGVRALGAGLHEGGLVRVRTIARELWTAYLMLGLFAGLALLVFREQFLEIMGLEPALVAGPGSYALPVAVFFGFCSLARSIVARAMEKFVGLTAIQVAFGTATWIGVAVGVGEGWGLAWALMWWTGMVACSFIVLSWWAGRLAGGLDWLPCFRFVEIRKSLSYNLHAFSGQVTSGATYHADKFLISHFLGAAAVGYYGLASSIASKLLSLVVALAGFVFPRTVRIFAADDVVGVRQTYIRSTRYVLLLAWPMLVVAVLLGDAFLRLWVGDVFANMAAELLMLLLVSYFLASMSVVASQIFNGIGNSRVGAFFSALGATTNVIACIVLIPRWGLSGAALASLLSMLQVFGYTHLLHRRLELPDFPFAELWLRLLVVGFIQAGVLWFGQRWLAGWWSLAALACLGWAIFYLGWYVLRFADEGDRDVMHRLWLAATQRTRFD